MPSPPNPNLRALPSVNTLAQAITPNPTPTIINAARQTIDAARQSILHDQPPPTLEHLISQAHEHLARAHAPALPPVINATGVLLHTGLGRAPLGPALADAVESLQNNYVPVELDLTTGSRGKRRHVVEHLLTELTGAQGATVVNNNAAAMVLTLAALATNREVIVSRGELVEIGGSFRLPEIITAGGAILREVGTTNRTRPADYERAITDRTAALLKVHPSNFRVEGFTEETTLEDIVQLARAHALPTMHDTGSGLLTDALRDAFGVDEPTTESSLRAGADLVLFSADKLLGGPQAGIIVGRADLIDRIERHPLMRAVRVDKLTLTVLAETLKHLRDPSEWEATLPVLRAIRQPVSDLHRLAELIADECRDLSEAMEVIYADAFIGGGSAPGQAIPSVALRIPCSDEQRLLTRLREGSPPIIARIHEGAVILDMRSASNTDSATLADTLRTALTSP